jgi:C4-type Zn-finger protein
MSKSSCHSTRLSMQYGCNDCAGRGEEMDFPEPCRNPLLTTTMHGEVTSNEQQRRSVCRSVVGTISVTRCHGSCVVLASTVVIKDTLGHSKVDLAMNVYGKAGADDIRADLRVASKKLLGRDLLQRICYQPLRSNLRHTRVPRKSCGCKEKW